MTTSTVSLSYLPSQIPQYKQQLRNAAHVPAHPSSSRWIWKLCPAVKFNGLHSPSGYPFTASSARQDRVQVASVKDVSAVASTRHTWRKKKNMQKTGKRGSDGIFIVDLVGWSDQLRSGQVRRAETYRMDMFGVLVRRPRGVCERRVGGGGRGRSKLQRPRGNPFACLFAGLVYETPPFPTAHRANIAFAYQLRTTTKPTPSTPTPASEGPSSEACRLFRRWRA